MSESAWRRLRDVESCVAANFPIVRQLGLFQIMPGTPPEWVYEVRMHRAPGPHWGQCGKLYTLVPKSGWLKITDVNDAMLRHCCSNV